MRLATTLLATFGLALLVSCSGSGSSARGGRSPGPEAALFAEAARKSGVPRDLLVAIAHVEGGLALPARRLVDPDSAIPTAGPLQLRHGRFDSLARGAALAHVTELALREDGDVALDAGALVVADLGARFAADAASLASFERAVEELSGFADEPRRRDYAHRVFRTLARGGVVDGRDGERIDIAPHSLPVALTVDLSTELHTLANPEFSGAEWVPTSCTNKCNTDRGGNAVSMVVVHDTECEWDAAVATLQNDSGKSVHYLIGRDGRTAQFIPESYTGWHAGNYYYNQRTVGIEHVGYTTKPFEAALYDASVKLVGYLVKKYGVAVDRAHIIGHDQVPNGNTIGESAAPCDKSPSACEKDTNYGGAGHHTDPGDWEWAPFMQRLGGSAKCNDVYNLWNCSADKTMAFRCPSGTVEIAHCDGPGACEAQPIGTDDLCHKAPAPPSPVDAGADAKADASHDGGARPVDASSPSPNDASVAPGAPRDASDTKGDAAIDGGAWATSNDGGGDSSGCSVSVARPARPTRLTWLPCIAPLALLLRRRRRGR